MTNRPKNFRVVVKKYRGEPKPLELVKEPQVTLCPPAHAEGVEPRITARRKRHNVNAEYMRSWEL